MHRRIWCLIHRVISTMSSGNASSSTPSSKDSSPTPPSGQPSVGQKRPLERTEEERKKENPSKRRSELAVGGFSGFSSPSFGPGKPSNFVSSSESSSFSGFGVEFSPRKVGPFSGSSSSTDRKDTEKAIVPQPSPILTEIDGRIVKFTNLHRTKRDQKFKEDLMERVRKNLCCYFTYTYKSSKIPDMKGVRIGYNVKEFRCETQIDYLKSYNPFLCNQCFTEALGQGRDSSPKVPSLTSPIVPAHAHQILQILREVLGFKESDLLERALKLSDL